MGNLAIKSSKPQTEQQNNTPQKLEAIKKPELNFQQFSEDADSSIEKNDDSKQKLGFTSNLEIGNPNPNSKLDNKKNILNKVVNVFNKPNEYDLNNIKNKLDAISKLASNHSQLLAEMKDEKQNKELEAQQVKINKKQDKATLEQTRIANYLNSLLKK